MKCSEKQGLREPEVEQDVKNLPQTSAMVNTQTKQEPHRDGGGGAGNQKFQGNGGESNAGTRNCPGIRSPIRELCSKKGLGCAIEK